MNCSGEKNPRGDQILGDAKMHKANSNLNFPRDENFIGGALPSPLVPLLGYGRADNSFGKTFPAYGELVSP